MFNLGLSEIILISIIALIFIGPKQLPEIARTFGRVLNELKRATDDLTGSFTNPKNYITKDSEPNYKPDTQQPTQIPKDETKANPLESTLSSDDSETTKSNPSDGTPT